MPELATTSSTPAGPSAQEAAFGMAAASPNRRQRLRLRDLCDEVLASFRVARERDVITPADRESAAVVLAGLSPRRS